MSKNLVVDAETLRKWWHSNETAEYSSLSFLSLISEHARPERGLSEEAKRACNAAVVYRLADSKLHINDNPWYQSALAELEALDAVPDAPTPINVNPLGLYSGQCHRCGRAIGACECRMVPPPKRLGWTRKQDGSLVSDKIGNGAWFEFNMGHMQIIRVDAKDERWFMTFGSGSCWGMYEAIHVLENYLFALGVTPESSEPPIIREETPPDPVEEIQRDYERGNTDFDCNDIGALLAEIDRLREAAEEDRT